MPKTTNRGWTYPASGTKPYFNEIVSFFNEIDADMQAAMISGSGVVDPTGYVFVDSDNGSNSGDGSSDAPYQTLAYAASTVTAPGDWATFNTPCIFSISGTHSAAITMPYRRQIFIIGGQATISGDIAWNYDVDYWDGHKPTSDSGLYIAPSMLSGFVISGDIICKNAVDKDAVQFRQLAILNSHLAGDIINEESGNATPGRQTGVLFLITQNCTSAWTNLYIGGRRETVMASAFNNTLYVSASFCDLSHLICGCSGFDRCGDTKFSGGSDWQKDIGGGAYLGAVGGSSSYEGLKDCTFTGGSIFGWDGATGQAPSSVKLDAATFKNLEDNGVTYDNMATEYELLDAAIGVKVDESGFTGALKPAVAGDSDAVQKCLNHFDEYLGAGDTTIVVERGADDEESGTNLIAAYARAAALSPSASNRVLLRIPAGSYDVGSATWSINTDFVDVEGFGEASWSLLSATDAPPSVTITSTNAYTEPMISISADDTHISGITVDYGARTGTSVIEFTDGFERGHMSNVVIRVGAATFAAHATPATIGGTFDHIITEGSFLAGGTVQSTVRNSILGASSLAGHESGGARA